MRFFHALVSFNDPILAISFYIRIGYLCLYYMVENDEIKSEFPLNYFSCCIF